MIAVAILALFGAFLVMVVVVMVVGLLAVEDFASRVQKWVVEGVALAADAMGAAICLVKGHEDLEENVVSTGMFGYVRCARCHRTKELY